MTKPLCVIVDDNPINTLLLEQALISRGCRTFAITEPLDAARVIADTGLTPAMVIIDQVMPELMGHQLAVNLRAQLGDQCTFVAWSAAALAPLERMVFDDVLSKPLNPAQLDDLVALHGLGDQPAPLESLSASERTGLVHLFTQTSDADLTALANALSQRALAEALQLHHKLDGSRAMLDLALPSLPHLEQALRQQNWAAAKALLPTLRREVLAVSEAG